MQVLLLVLALLSTCRQDIDSAVADAAKPRRGGVGDVCQALDRERDHSCSPGLHCCIPGGWQGAAWTCQRACTSQRP